MDGVEELGAMVAAPDVFFRPAELADLDQIFELEAAGYPADEAASREAIEFRLHHAPGLFLAAVRADAAGAGAGAVVGYVCGTLAAGPPLTHASMGAHDPGGALLCVHSVCVAAPERRRGLAARMLRAYLPYVQTTTPGAAEVRLLCKAPLESLYRGAGFAVVGPSAVVHGAEPWTEMALEFE